MDIFKLFQMHCVVILFVSEIKENKPSTMSLTSPVPDQFPQ